MILLIYLFSFSCINTALICLFIRTVPTSRVVPVEDTRQLEIFTVRDIDLRGSQRGNMRSQTNSAYRVCSNLVLCGYNWLHGDPNSTSLKHFVIYLSFFNYKKNFNLSDKGFS